MNILDLPGPEFLAVFWALAIVGLCWAWWRERREVLSATDLATLRHAIVDPYCYACLRGWGREAAVVAVFTVLERGWVHMDAKKRLTVTGAGLSAGSQAVGIEGQALVAARASTPLWRALGEIADSGPVKAYKTALRRLNLIGAVPLPNMLCVVLLLDALAAVKFNHAVSNGHHNVGFLVISAWVLSIGYLLMVNAKGPANARGRQLLRDRKTLLAGLQDHADVLERKPGNETVIWLAAVFGAAGLPPDLYPQLKVLHLIGQRRDGAGSGGCGSGGGGGGGGCGGCGGGH